MELKYKFMLLQKVFNIHFQYFMCFFDYYIYAVLWIFAFLNCSKVHKRSRFFKGAT